MTHKVDKRIMVRTSFKGTHNWPEASQYAGPQVAFLEHPHRHTFYVNVELLVTESDREVEFYIFQGQVNKIIAILYQSTTDQNQLVYELGRRSCETIAEELIEGLRNMFNHQGTLAAEVWEDNEVGARIVSHVER